MITSEDKLKHLEHVEDHHINAGDHGFAHAFHTLHDVHKSLKGEKTKTTVTTKYDGSPAIVFGHHPQTKKFFVATKSAFNKTPKINYTHEDIERNHGHAPGLVNKLKSALDHLHKVTPKGHVYQGDLMYDHADLKKHPSHVSFTPNTIEYTAHKGSEHFKHAQKAKVGVVVHTEYKGDSVENMKAHHAPDTSKFGSHPDVHLIHPHADLSKAHYPEPAQQQFEKHLQTAVHHSTEMDHKGLTGHVEHLKTYINHTVRTGTKPSFSGYSQHLQDRAAKDVDSVKTEASKNRKKVEHSLLLASAHKNKEHIEHSLKVHHHLQQAKNVLVHALSTHSEFEHKIRGKATKPEGFVAIRDGRPSKLVDRSEFSAANFDRSPK
jgi:hypothetical protein